MVGESNVFFFVEEMDGGSDVSRPLLKAVSFRFVVGCERCGRDLCVCGGVSVGRGERGSVWPKRKDGGCRRTVSTYGLGSMTA